MKTLQEELIEIEPRRDFLHEVCGCGVFEEIIKTLDGFFLGRQKGHCGFNDFLGKPSVAALRRTRDYILQLSQPNAERAVKLLAQFDYVVSFPTYRRDGVYRREQ